MDNEHTGLTPQGGTPDAQGTSELRAAASNLANKIAKHYYGLELLQGRNLTIQGKLRFDIAPGSLIRVSTPQIADVTPALTDLFGLVERVTISVVAGEGGASSSTTFLLGHVRTEKENNDDAVTFIEHPVYEQGYSGAPLVDAFNFAD